MKTIGEIIIDRLLIACDEEELEERLEIAIKTNEDTWSLREALQKLDALKLAGTYEIERRRLIKHYKKQPPISIPKLDPIVGEIILRLGAAMKAKPRLTDKVEEFWRTIRDRGLIEVASALLKPARKPGGRKPRRQYPEDRARLVRMKQLIKTGKTVPAAARSVIDLTKAPKTQASDAKRLETMYRDRQALRSR